MRRTFVLPALVVCLLACKAKTKPEGEAEPASQGPVLSLPAVELPDPATRRADTNLWITSDAIWVAGSEQKPERVVELTSISDAAPELIEPLAEALDRLAGERIGEDFIVMDPSGVGFEISVRVDADTTVGVLRRVLTTARATGHRRVRYESAKGSVELEAEVPVRAGQRFDEVLFISRTASATPEDGFALNANPMAHDALFTRLERTLEFQSNHCVVLEMAPTIRYADWLAFVAELVAIDIDCVTVPSPATPADLPPPPPPPPPPSSDDEGPAPSAPKPEPEPDPGIARVEHWWSQAQARVDEQGRARCEQALSPLREVAEAELSVAQLEQLARFEGSCGDSARVDALRILRTERFPDDWRGWHALALFRFEPLWPDPEAGLPYQAKVEPARRKAIAEQVLAALEHAIALAPSERDPRVWASMAHTQLALAWEAETSEAAQRHARVEHMRAWQQQQVICEADPVAGCPPAPSTDEQFTADLSALGESR